MYQISECHLMTTVKPNWIMHWNGPSSHTHSSAFPFIATVISKCMMEKECVPTNNYMKGYPNPEERKDARVQCWVFVEQPEIFAASNRLTVNAWWWILNCVSFSPSENSPAWGSSKWQSWHSAIPCWEGSWCQRPELWWSKRMGLLLTQ